MTRLQHPHAADEHGTNEHPPAGTPSHSELPGRGSADPEPAAEHLVIVHALPPERPARQARAIIREVLESAALDASDIDDAELAVGELAANATLHARGPYELRIILHSGYPIRCEVVDGDCNLAGIPDTFARLSHSAVADEGPHTGEPPKGSGHGLAIVHRLSEGHCSAFTTTLSTTGEPGKAVAFHLPATCGPASAALQG